MTKTQRYVIWLKGFLDACDNKPTDKQVEIIKGVLNSLFEHEALPPKAEVKKEEKPKIWEPERPAVYRC